MESPKHLTFGPFRLDLANESLWRGQQRVPLKPKTFSVLRYLIEHTDRLVTKEELLEALWADVRVSEAVVKVGIREIREALGDQAKTPQFIETVHRRGYRWIAEINSQKFEPIPDTQPLTPKLVGRETELGQLHQWLEKALSGERQIVFVTGELGIGKTTLVETFLAHLTGRADLWIAQGHCLEQYGAGEAYMPVLEAFGQLCREPGHERVREVLSQHAPTWLVQMPGFLNGEELEALQRRVVGATKDRLLREMAEAIEVLTAERALVLQFDDLHWSDHATLNLISYLARRSQQARLLVIGTYRPADVAVREHPLKAIKQDLQLHRYCEELPVERLPETAVAEYLAARLGASNLPARLTRLVYQRTEGNPLFMVNLVDDMVTQAVMIRQDGQWELTGNVERIAVPASIREFIEQRVERLSPEAQRVLEAASIAGIEFSAAVVAAGVEKTVDEVEKICEGLARQMQFLQVNGTAEWPDGVVAMSYGFIHALYQQVLSERVTVRQRIALHQRIGERLEAAYGARAGEVAAELAVHFEQGRDAHRALQYCWQAGLNASRRYAHQEAIAHYTKGLELLAALPDTPEHTQQELMWQITLGGPLIAAKGHAAPEVQRVYARARELCQQVGETPQLFPALTGLYRFYAVRGEYKMAHELATQLMRVAQNTQEQTFFMAAHGMLGYVLFLLGELGSAQEHLERSIACYNLSHHRFFALLYGDDPGVASLAFAALALWFRGYPDQALKRSHEALRLAQELSHPHVLTTALGLAAQLHHFRREPQAAREQAEAALALATEQGFPLWAAVGTISHGWALTVQGQVKEGILQLRQGLAALRDIGLETERSDYLALLAEADGKGSRSEEGLAVLTEALTQVDRSGERFYEAELYRLYGELLLTQKGSRLQAVGHREKTEEAEACFLKAIEIARKQQAKSLELRAVMSLSRLWQQRKKDEARRQLAEVYGWFTEGFDTKDLQEAKALLGELS